MTKFTVPLNENDNLPCLQCADYCLCSYKMAPTNTYIVTNNPYITLDKANIHCSSFRKFVDNQDINNKFSKSNTENQEVTITGFA